MTLAILRSLLTPPRLWATLVVLAVMLLFGRLGIWQVERYREKQVQARFMAIQYRLPALEVSTEPLPEDPAEWHFRRTILSGQWDFHAQAVWRGQTRNGEPGAHLITPLRLANDRAILVDRGWIPYQQAVAPDSWAQFGEGGEAREEVGVLLPSQPLPPALHPPPGGVDWVQVDVGAMGARLPYPVLPVYAQLLPTGPPGPEDLPAREDLYVELSAGTHLSYAVQWFSFALILGFGYYMFFRVRALRAQAPASREDSSPPGPAEVD